jgi:hypothetical protein
MQGPIAIMDLETVSQYNPPTEPLGQERRIGRPDVAIVNAALNGVPAGISGSIDLSVTPPPAITSSNNTLSAKIASADSFSTVTIPPGTYGTAAALAVAVNAGIAASGLAANAIVNSLGPKLVLQSNTKGAGSYIQIQAGTFNAVVGFAASTFTMPTAQTIVTALLPPGGPLNMTPATILTQTGSGGTSAQRDALLGTIAPHFVETDAFIKSFQVGMISGYRSATYNPDPSRLPALTPGAAISVVQEDGTTAFAAPLTAITAAVHDSPSTGDLTITGTNLGNAEWQQTVVKVSSADGSRSVKIYQKTIQSTLSAGTQGVVSATSIVIPASLLAGLGIVGSKVRVQYTSMVSNLFTAT